MVIIEPRGEAGRGGDVAGKQIYAPTPKHPPRISGCKTHFIVFAEFEYPYVTVVCDYFDVDVRRNLNK